MGTTSHLATYGITIEEARDFVMSNILTPSVIYETCLQFGVTNQMLGEIVGVPTETVVSFWEDIGLDAASLSGESSDPQVPTTFTNYSGEEFEIVVGSSGNDIFMHTSGFKVYFGMDGNDTFSSASNASGKAVFVGGTGNDTYNLDYNGVITVSDIGGGYDTINNYVFDNDGVDYLIGDIAVASFEVNDSGDRTGSGILIGDLSNASDNIEAFYFPGLLDGFLTVEEAINYFSTLDSWRGVENTNLSAANYGFVELAGIYAQYVDAGIGIL